MLHHNLTDQYGLSGSSVPWFVQIGSAVGVICILFSLILSGSTSSPHSSQAVVQTAGVGLPSSFAMADPEGEEIYQRICSTCHGAEGQGTTGVFPPVSGTEWVTGDEGRLIRLISHGLEGAIEVNGYTYAGFMPGWQGMLDDEELAAVVNYIRTSWENDAETVTAEDVQRVREATEGRRDPWTPEEFEDEENLGIPGDNDE